MCSGTQDAGQPRQCFIADEAAFLLAALGPGVGIKQISLRQRGLRQAVDDLARVAGVNADIGQLALVDLGEKFGDAVDKGLTADKAGFWSPRGLRGEMLAAAEADFETYFRRSKIRKERRRINRRADIYGQLRQQVLDKAGMVGPQLLALAAAMQRAFAARR